MSLILLYHHLSFYIFFIYFYFFFLILRPPPISTLFPYTTLFRSIIILLAYFIGSIPFALVIGKGFYKTDVRKHGSGNLGATNRSEEHTSELQSRRDLVCRLLLEKKKKKKKNIVSN